MDRAGAPEVPDDVETQLVDLSDLPLRSLLADENIGDSVLQAVLKRTLDPDGDGRCAVSAFGSSI